jgi:hypothetical protein
MTSDLFPDLPPSESPMLRWKREHGIITWRYPGHRRECYPCWCAGFQKWWPEYTDGADFFLYESSHNGESRCVGFVADCQSEEEALLLLARWYELPTWKTAWKETTP